MTMEGGMARSNRMLNGGQVIVDYLIREKVPYAFGLCGHGNIGFIEPTAS
jgi:acetolactate synthase I/II/III large subunit